mmetsp:Transcript_81864/g.226894  ORF Transcript_81864/g.226894 Transcript_81864/m.226894 type:complete len:176 (-) Transcript_81864:191-718(-)
MGPMCTMHDSCSQNSFEWDRWIKPIHDGVNITVLQDTKKVNFFQQVGHGLRFHDDLIVYDRCGDLFWHLCTTGMMGSCQQMKRDKVMESSLLVPEGYTTLRTIVLLAAQHAMYSCQCSPEGRAHPFSYFIASVAAVFFFGTCVGAAVQSCYSHHGASKDPPPTPTQTKYGHPSDW